MKKLVLLIAFMLTLSAIWACGSEDGREYRVQLVVSDGVQINGERTVKVQGGGSAVFELSMGDTIAIKEVKCGDESLDFFFDYNSGILTVPGVRANMRLTLTAYDIGYSTSERLNYCFVGGDKDLSSSADGVYNVGTRVTLVAGDKQRIFIGWTLGGYIHGGGVLLSDDRAFSFNLTPDLAIGEYCYVFANYEDAGRLTYNANGGVVNPLSSSFDYSKYYDARLIDSGICEVAFDAEWFDEVGAATTFWDDGTFSREGYVLMEYNTKPDGTGVGYSLGSLYPLADGTELYCIWAEDSPHTDFTYTEITIPRPVGVSAAYAHNWVESGIVITSYLGDSDTVTIPESIDGRCVIAIGPGAIVNKSVRTLVLNKRIVRIHDGAILGCDKLETIYYPDGIAYISNAALDGESYSSLRSLFVNATMAPRYSKSEGGCFAKKLARFLANPDKQRIVVLSGSSSYCGLSVEYLEALIDDENVCAVNFGTTRTTHIYMYLEAMGTLAKEGDIILYAPENSIYEMGEPRLYWKTLRDLEGMYNIFRGVDISGYDNVFGAFAEFNMGSGEGAYDPLLTGRYKRATTNYCEIVDSSSFNEYGELITKEMSKYLVESNYKWVYEVTLNNRFKSILEGEFSSAKPEEEPWETSEKWCSADEEIYLINMNRAISSAKSSGALVYFTFSPVDYASICTEAKIDFAAWCDAYENFISENYCFDGILGSVENYVFAHKYFYNNAYHTNDYGRVYRTHRMYLDLCELLGIEEIRYIYEMALPIEGCLFEEWASDSPLTPYWAE